jgi:hypothetical protein
VEVRAEIVVDNTWIWVNKGVKAQKNEERWPDIQQPPYIKN